MTEISSLEFVKAAKECLERNQPESLIELFKNNENEKLYIKTANELVPIIANNLNSSNLNGNKLLFKTCEDILEIIADTCDPVDMVLLLCEQAEDDDVKFQALLKPLIMSMRKGNLSETVDFFTISTRAYIEDLPQPQNQNPDDENTSAVPSKDDKLITQRLLSIQDSIVVHLKPLIEDMSSDFNIKPKIILSMLNLLLNLFGKPFIYLNIKDDDENNTNFHNLAEQIVKLECDPFKLLKIIDNRRRKIASNDTSDDEEDQSKVHMIEKRFLDVEVSNLTYGYFYLTLLTSSQLKSIIPQVYNPHWVMINCCYLANELLAKPEYALVTKGLRLIDSVIQTVDNESIQHGALKVPIHINLLTTLSQVMMYNDCSSERQLSLKIFKCYVDLFTMRARYLLIQHLFDIKRHSGFRALIINLLKSFIIKSLEATPHCQYFIGNKLMTIVKKICKISDDDSTDLVDISDEVTGILNLLRYLFIRDKENITGIWMLTDFIQQNYLEKIQKHIVASRNHWKVELNSLEEKVKHPGGSNDDSKVSVSVGGMNLPDISTSEKIKMGHQALTAIDMIESILIRVNECLENNPLKLKSNKVHVKD
ncbi:glomulin [Aphidius gifuensis]|uniref:glomulin n=1 Tax=Aphidius gifuensis TaxID=684658 RepID=UPI001CDB4E27|nr:glomulin [Aphidius gifuensis]